MGNEAYKPSSEEMKKAVGMMSPDDRILSRRREINVDDARANAEGYKEDGTLRGEYRDSLQRSMRAKGPNPERFINMRTYDENYTQAELRAMEELLGPAEAEAIKKELEGDLSKTDEEWEKKQNDA